MEQNEARHRIEALRQEINAHNRHYYLENAPQISDYEFDLLLKELIQLEELYPQFKSADSPTNKVGSDLETSNAPFRQYAHLHPMLSLANTYSIEELSDFDSRVRKGTSSAFTYNCELKFDGTGINLLYRNGILVRALTRGDGTTGDDVTRNLRNLKSGARSTCLSILSTNSTIRGNLKKNPCSQTQGMPLQARSRCSLPRKWPKEAWTACFTT